MSKHSVSCSAFAFSLSSVTQILHTDNALFGITLYDRETFRLQSTLQASPHHTATPVTSAPLLLSTGVSPTEVELPLRLVLCYYEAHFRKTGYYFTTHTHPDAFNCFQSSRTTSTKDMRLTSRACMRTIRPVNPASSFRVAL